MVAHDGACSIRRGSVEQDGGLTVSIHTVSWSFPVSVLFTVLRGIHPDDLLEAAVKAAEGGVSAPQGDFKDALPRVFQQITGVVHFHHPSIFVVGHTRILMEEAGEIDRAVFQLLGQLSQRT